MITQNKKNFLIKYGLKCSLLGGALFALHGPMAKTTLRVGTFLPLSGGQANFGEDTLNGIRMAVNEINKSAKDVTIDLKVEDEKSEPADAANAVKKLIAVDRVHVLLGSVASSNTMAAAPIAQASKIPLLTPSSTNVKVTEAGDFISRICFIDDFQGESMAKFSYEDMGFRRAAIITDLASDYSRGLAAAFKTAFIKLGGKIVTEVSYQQKDQNFSSQLTRVRTQKPDMVFVPGYYTEVGNMIRQARALKITAPFLGGDGWSGEKLFELGGEAIAGNYFSSHFIHSDPDPKVQDFVKKYQETYKKVPTDMASLGYDAVYVLVDAFRRNGGKTDAEGLKNAINSTANFVGVSGSITLDEKRNARKSLVVLETTATDTAFKKKVDP